jgi:hypothetical protein
VPTSLASEWVRSEGLAPAAARRRALKAPLRGAVVRRQAACGRAVVTALMDVIATGSAAAEQRRGSLRQVPVSERAAATRLQKSIRRGTQSSRSQRFAARRQAAEREVQGAARNDAVVPLAWLCPQEACCEQQLAVGSKLYAIAGWLLRLKVLPLPAAATRAPDAGTELAAFWGGTTLQSTHRTDRTSAGCRLTPEEELSECHKCPESLQNTCLMSL